MFKEMSRTDFPTEPIFKLTEDTEKMNRKPRGLQHSQHDHRLIPDSDSPSKTKRRPQISHADEILGTRSFNVTGILCMPSCF